MALLPRLSTPLFSSAATATATATHSISPFPLDLFLFAEFLRAFGRASVSVLRSHKDFILQPRSLNGVRISSLSLVERRFTIARASSVTDGKEGDAPLEQSAVSVENLPLESKLQMKLEQKLRMKLAKKIRLRRKRLLRKLRWPPSKLKKLKNV